MANPTDDDARPRAADWLRLAIPVVVFGGFLAAAWKIGYFQLKNPQRLNAAAEQAAGTPWFAPMFVAVYAALAALALPVAPLAYASGAIFGVVRGGLFIWISSLIGGIAGYALARSVLAGPARRLLGRHKDKLERLKHTNAFLAGIRFHALPFTPFGIVNHAAAVSDIPAVPFLAGTAVGVLPATFVSAFIGERVEAGLAHGDRTALWLGIGLGATILTLSFAPALLKRLRR